MSENLPAPLVAADVVLRDFDYMPLFGERLFKSDTWILCDDVERVAALRAWWASWHQEPAGSLPDDDRLLSDLCGYGVAVSAWKKVRPAALRGWVRCSDGRLYHPVVCEIASDVHRKKRKKEADTAAERERKRRKRAQSPPDTLPLSGGHATGIPPENALKGKGEGIEGIPPSGPPFAEAVAAWNAMAERTGLASVQRLTETRKRLLRARLRDVGGIEGIAIAIGKVEASAFLTGRRPGGQGHEKWKCTFDFFLKEASFTKLLEGQYDDREGAETEVLGGGRGNGELGRYAGLAEFERRLAESDLGRAQPPAER